jgi:hypothetical protein
MKFINSSVVIVLGMIICGAAHARTLQYDCGQYDTSLSDAPLAPDGFALSIVAGADSTAGGCSGFNGAGDPTVNTPGNQWMLQGGVVNPPTGSPFDPGWEVLVTEPTTSAFTVEFLYDSTTAALDPACLTETATLTLLTGSYSYKGACGGSGDYTFTFNAKTGQLEGSAWQGVVASAPEIDPRSAISGLTLLFGFIAVMRGRRKSGGRHHAGAALALR